MMSRGRRRQFVPDAHWRIRIKSPRPIGRSQCLIEIGQDIVYMFDANAESDHFRLDPCGIEFIRGQLPVGC